jgi:hypothetical protein
MLVDILTGRTRLERGEAAAISRRVGCSREYVRQAMRQLGVTVKPPPEPQSCTGCGKAMRYSKTRFCQSCRRKNAYVTLKCVNCGKAFKRRRSLHDAYLRRIVPQGRRGTVCSKQCSAKVPRSCSWCGQPAGTRWRANVGRQAFCGPPALCRFEAQRAIHPVWWRYLTDDLLPLKDHLDGITRLLATLPAKPSRAR